MHALRASSFGADPSLTDESAKTALERAKEKPTSGHREVERILENPEAFREVSIRAMRDFVCFPGFCRYKEFLIALLIVALFFTSILTRRRKGKSRKTKRAMALRMQPAAI